MLGLVPGIWKLKSKGLDFLSALGWLLVAVGATIVAAEYHARAEWVILRRIGARYMAFTMIAVGSFLACRDRSFLATLGLGGFIWDLSSAVFWAALRKNPRATVPVPWYHHFEQEEGAGAPRWGPTPRPSLHPV
ncbi:MAG: hypothetical protein PHO53_03080 [Actinomycetota bacterium]|nr:hypothetical protein [Actinomycetota bacterium]